MNVKESRAHIKQQRLALAAKRSTERLPSYGTGPMRS